MDLKDLHAKIGQLALENDFLAGAATCRPTCSRPVTVARCMKPSSAGVSLSVFDWLLSALPYRIVGLSEHDLLQALPRYAFIGASSTPRT